MKKENQGDVTIYRGPGGEVEVKLAGETVWLSLNQIASLFGRDKSVISRHLTNVFKELDRDSVVADFATTAPDGKTYRVAHYSLDAILSVGYRVNSKQGTRFRQWATRTLNEHLTRGFAVRFEQNAQEFEALAMVRRLAGSEALTTDTAL